jgi:hypothetical protein
MITQRPKKDRYANPLFPWDRNILYVASWYSTNIMILARSYILYFSIFNVDFHAVFLVEKDVPFQ